jgi:hypothetical protein
VRKRILVLGSMALLPAVLAAQFGGIVSDPIQEGHSAEQLVNDIQKINQLIRTYNQITATYNQMLYMATYLRNRSAWLGIATRMVNSNTLGGFGETAAWNNAANLGLNIPGAYANATYAMTPPPFYSSWPIGNSIQSAIMASVRILDGTNPAALMSVANARMNQPQNDLALSHLEAQTQDATAQTNSEVDQLNLANGGIVLLNRQLETLNSLSAAQAEGQLVANKIQRDVLADAINFNGQVDFATANQATAWGASAATIQNW